jgi:hypothetical protein
MTCCESGTNVADSTGDVNDEMPTPVRSPLTKPASRLMEGGASRDFAQSYWQGVLGEFRNHLSIVMARAGELSAVLPSAIAVQSADCLADIDGSTSFMEGMLTWMDAALVPGSVSITDIGEILHRATQMAAAGLHPRVTLWVETLPAVVRNRGTAVESALAALIIELARGPDSSSLLSAVRKHQDDDLQESAVPVNVKLTVRPGRGDVRIVIATDGSLRPQESSWRLSLARALLASVGGDVGPSTDGDHRPSNGPSSLANAFSSSLWGFEVRFRLQ